MGKVTTAKLFVQIGSKSDSSALKSGVIQPKFWTQDGLSYFTEHPSYDISNEIISRLPEKLREEKGADGRRPVEGKVMSVLKGELPEYKTAVRIDTSDVIDVVIVKDGNGLKATLTLKDEYLSYKIVPYEIEKDDVCFGTIASWVEKNKNIFTAEVFSDQKEAERYLMESKDHPYIKDADTYKIEVFSRRHIEQMKWYQRSLEEIGIIDKGTDEFERI